MFETTAGRRTSVAMLHVNFFQGNIMLASIGAILLLFATVTSCWADDQAKRLLSLIDYIGGDYRKRGAGRESHRP